MKRLIALLAALLWAPGLQAQETKSFALINGTPFTIVQVKLSATDLNNWSPNMLAPPPLKAGERRQLSVPAPAFTCTVDLKLVFVENGNEPQWQSLNLCMLLKIRLRYDPYSGVSTATYEE
jgi:hypothetical protein